MKRKKKSGHKRTCHITIDDVTTDKNRALVEEVGRKLKIRLLPNKDSGWGSLIKNGEGKIFYSDSKYKEEAFVHELLHLKCQLDGYKRPVICFTDTRENNAYSGGFICALDNELQHRKMYPQFLQMGYSPARFYCDEDSDEMAEFADEVLNKKFESTNYFFLMTQYMTVLSPGADEAFADKLNDIKAAFKNARGPSLRKVLDKMEEQFAEWENSSSLDNQPVISQILQGIPGITKIFVGYNKANKSDGFYPAERFGFEVRNGDVFLLDK